MTDDDTSAPAYRSLVVGRHYPMPIQEGVTLDALAPGGTLLRIGGHDFDKSEQHDYRRGALQFGIAAQDTAILTLWRFGAQPWIDAPFDAITALENDRLSLSAVKAVAEGNDMRVAVQIHLVDLRDHKLRGLRLTSLSRPASQALARAIGQQLEHPGSGRHHALNRLLEIPTQTLADTYGAL